MKAIISKAARRKWAWVLALVMIVSIVIPTSLLTAKADVGTVKFIDGAAGWLESAYAQWTIDNQAEGYTAYIKKASQSDSAYARIDNELIRKYKNYYRVDAVGLAAGDYVIKVVPVKNGKEVTDKAQVTKTLNVSSFMTDPDLHFHLNQNIKQVQVRTMRMEHLRQMLLFFMLLTIMQRQLRHQ